MEAAMMRTSQSAQQIRHRTATVMLEILAHRRLRAERHRKERLMKANSAPMAGVPAEYGVARQAALMLGALGGVAALMAVYVVVASWGADPVEITSSIVLR
jgi:hypothetical protein